MNKAALSLTDSPGLRYSALPYMLQPVNSEACFSRTNGVFPICDMIEFVSYYSIYEKTFTFNFNIFFNKF